MKTIKVRIAVGVAADGKWSCSGWNDCDDTSTAGIALECLDAEISAGVAKHIVWLEAEVPLPEPLVVEGVVTATVEVPKE